MAAMISCISIAPRICASHCTSSSSKSVASHAVLGVQPLKAWAKLEVNSCVLRAGNSSGVEPDLDEEFRDIHATAGEDQEYDFPYGKADGSHTWHGNENGEWWENIVKVFETSGGPVGAQGAISWLFIPVILAGMFFEVPQDYLFICTILFIFAFIGIEMAKPGKPTHFEPDMYKLKK